VDAVTPVAAPVDVAAAPVNVAAAPVNVVAAPVHPTQPSSQHVAATPSGPAPSQPAAEPVRRPLEDPRSSVDTAVRDFAQNPEAALGALQKLNSDFAPHPLVLQSLALYNYRAGRIEPSIELAREAIPLCFERGQSFLVAELFREMRQYRSQLALTREQFLTVGHALIKVEDYATAAKAYTAVIGQDQGEVRAVKGLLQVAEKILHERRRPEAAIKVYRYLLQHCSSSPLVEFMQTGLEDAERTMSQTTAG
jgi:tetratricopeptide (TPR) repeat protein